MLVAGELESRIAYDTGVSIDHGIVLEALTMEKAREGGNMERLETIKLAISIYVARQQFPEDPEEPETTVSG